MDFGKGKPTANPGLRFAEKEAEQNAKDAHEAEDDADADDVATQNPAEYQKHNSEECKDLARKAHEMFSSTGSRTCLFALE
jgi:hypothetical protein